MSKTWGELLVFDKRREVSFGLNQLEFAENEGLENQVSSIPLHPNISRYILHTVLNTSPKVLTRRICLTIKSFYHR